MTEEQFERCIEKICRGDKLGLKEIYEAYLPYLYRIVYGIVQNKEDAEDITSDFFVKLWTLAPKYEAGRGHKGYLAAIARNMAVDHIRKHRREILVCENGTEEEDGNRNGLAKEFSGELPAGAGGQYRQETPEEQVVSRISLREALDRLKPEERRIIDMKVLGEMTFKEISELLEIPMGTVTWRYQEGLKRLRRYGYE